MNASAPVKHPENAGRKEQTLVVWVCCNHEQVLGVLKLLGQESHITAHQVGDYPLQHGRENECDQCNLDKTPPGPA